MNLWRDSELNVTINDILLEVQSQTMKCLTEFLEDQKCSAGEKDKAIVFEVIDVEAETVFEWRIVIDSAAINKHENLVRWLPISRIEGVTI